EERRQEPLQANDAAYVDENKRSGERGVDEGAVYDHVDVEEARTQHRDPDGERDQEHGQGYEGAGQGQNERRTIAQGLWKEEERGQEAEQGADRDHRPGDYPLRLPPLARGGDTTVTVDLRAEHAQDEAHEHQPFHVTGAEDRVDIREEVARDLESEERHGEPARPTRRKPPAGKE